MLKQTMKCDPEGDALILMKTARIVREDIFQSKGFHFNGLQLPARITAYYFQVTGNHAA